MTQWDHPDSGIVLNCRCQCFRSADLQFNRGFASPSVGQPVFLFAPGGHGANIRAAEHCLRTAIRSFEMLFSVPYEEPPVQQRRFGISLCREGVSDQVRHAP